MLDGSWGIYIHAHMHVATEEDIAILRIVIGTCQISLDASYYHDGFVVADWVRPAVPVVAPTWKCRFPRKRSHPAHLPRMQRGQDGNAQRRDVSRGGAHVTVANPDSVLVHVEATMPPMTPSPCPWRGQTSMVGV